MNISLLSFFNAVMFTALLLSPSGFLAGNEPVFESKQIRMFGTDVALDQLPQARVGGEDALLPLALLDAMDLTTHEYDATQGRLTIRHSGDEYTFRTGVCAVEKNGQTVALPIAPLNDGSSFFFPAKFLLTECQARMRLGATVEIYIPTYVAHPTLKWSGDLTFKGEPLDYRIQIATDPGFANLVLSDTVAFTLQYVPAAPLLPGEYWWRVKPMTDGDLTTGWMETRWLKVANPQKEYRISTGADAEQIHRVIQDAARHTPATVQFEPGTYRVSPSFRWLQCKPHSSQYGGGVNPPCLIELIGAKNLLLEGNGATICMENQASFLKAFVSRNVAFRNFTVATAAPLKPAGRITQVTPSKSQLEMELFEDQVTPEENPAYFSNFNEGFALTTVNGSTKRGSHTRIRHIQLPEKISGRTYRVLVAPLESEEAFVRNLEAGDLLYFVPKQGGAYGTLGLFAEYCEDLTFQNFRKFENGGYSYILKHCEKLKFLHFTDRPRSIHDHSEGGMVASGRSGIWMEHCQFWNYSDDGPQNSTEPLEIDAVTFPRTVLLKPDTALRGTLALPEMNFPAAKHWATNDVRRGDKVMLYTNQVDPGDLRYTVQSVEPRNGRIEVTLDRDIPKDTPLEFQKPFPSGRTVLVNISSCQTGAAYRHCLFKNIARNGIYGAASQFLVENCRFEQIGEVGLRVADFVPADCSHILIRNNHLVKTNLNCTAQEALSIGVLMYDRAKTWRNGMQNVFILQNQITDHNKVGCALWATQNVLISGNHWENSEYTDFGFHCWGKLSNEFLQLKHCKSVRFEHNQITDNRPALHKFRTVSTEDFTQTSNHFPSQSEK